METIASAVLLGVAVLFAGNLPWSVMLAPLSLRVLPGVPWALVPMAILSVAVLVICRGTDRATGKRDQTPGGFARPAAGVRRLGRGDCHRSGLCR